MDLYLWVMVRLVNMGMKKCTKCDSDKPLTEFYKAVRMKDGYQSSCKSCADVSTKGSRAKNPKKYHNMRYSYAKQRQAYITSLKMQSGCVCCGEDELCCLDFHHLDPTQKKFNISSAATKCGWGVLLEEIQKCVIVCANCHRKIHNNLITISS